MSLRGVTGLILIVNVRAGPSRGECSKSHKDIDAPVIGAELLHARRTRRCSMLPEVTLESVGNAAEIERSN